MTHLTIRITVPVPPAPLPPEPARLFGRVYHDIELPDGLTRPELVVTDEDIKAAEARGEVLVRPGGLPETVKAVDSDWVPLSRLWQFYWFDLLKFKAQAAGYDEDLVNLFRVITRSNAFKTNGHGAENGLANYVTGQNLQAKPIRTEVILTGGAYLEILEGGQLFPFRNKSCYKFATLDYHNLPPISEYLSRPTPWAYFATTSRVDRTVIALTGGIDIPTPNIGLKSWHYIEASRVQLLPPGAPVPCPYVPARW